MTVQIRKKPHSAELKFKVALEAARGEKTVKKRQEQVTNFHKDLSKWLRARLLGVNLSSCYVKPKSASQATVTVMNEIRDIYEVRPFQGYRRMTLDLKDLGYGVNHKRVYRLMNLMGLQAVYPKKNLKI